MPEERSELEWFLSLKEMFEQGDYEAVSAAIDGAIKVLSRPVRRQDDSPASRTTEA